MSDEAMNNHMKTIRKIITEGCGEKATQYINAGEYLIKNYPKGSLGFERGSLCLALAEFFTAVGEAIKN